MRGFFNQNGSGYLLGHFLLNSSGHPVWYFCREQQQPQLLPQQQQQQQAGKFCFHFFPVVSHDEIAS
jgi:hypothetical protein